MADRFMKFLECAGADAPAAKTAWAEPITPLSCGADLLTNVGIFVAATPSADGDRGDGDATTKRVT